MNRAMNRAVKRTMNREMKRTMKNKEILFVPIHGGAQDTLVLVKISLDHNIIHGQTSRRWCSKLSALTWKGHCWIIFQLVLFRITIGFEIRFKEETIYYIFKVSSLSSYFL